MAKYSAGVSTSIYTPAHKMGGTAIAMASQKQRKTPARRAQCMVIDVFSKGDVKHVRHHHCGGKKYQQ